MPSFAGPKRVLRKHYLMRLVQPWIALAKRMLMVGLPHAATVYLKVLYPLQRRNGLHGSKRLFGDPVVRVADC